MKARMAALTALLLFTATLPVSQGEAKKPYRNAFFTNYPGLTGTQIDDLPSNAGHCGICHFDFNGGGPRNFYGHDLEVALRSGLYATTEDAIMSIENEDSDGDGYANITEIENGVYFLNTPTFPGLSSANYNFVSNVDTNEIVGILTPSGSTDSIPPIVNVATPNGGEVYAATMLAAVTWTALDSSGISHVDIYMSDDNGATYRPVARREANDGSFSWFVPNRPGANTLIRVVAFDNSGNPGFDDSNGTFDIIGAGGPTTFRDMDLAGTQPHTTAVFEDPDANCVSCHGNYNSAVEPWYNWKGSMMAQAMRDPLFLACLAVAEQDAPSVGDLCLRCHTPTGWLEGRSVDTGGGLVNERDREGISCDFCHRLVDPDYDMGTSPDRDQGILAALDDVPATSANGEFVVDPYPVRRGPYSDASSVHHTVESPFHQESDLCGTCHDVSNPVFVVGDSLTVYELDPLDQRHVDLDLRNMFPIERTYSEWTMSEYAATGVYAPQFAGAKPDGIVSSCQDCHMADVVGRGCDTGPTRNDLGLHDLTGGNTFIPDILHDFYPGEVDTNQLQAGKARATAMLQKAASMLLDKGQVGLNPTVTVTLTNECGHKLPSGYPEGRRIWLHIEAWDAADSLVYESGAYDQATGVLDHDEDVKIYQIKPGISSRISPVVGLPVGPSFHFVLNDTVFSDNRIPPRGFTNANFEAIQSPPVAYVYADSQNWDTTTYVLPEDARFVQASLYYQTTTKEYVEFLRDANMTNSAGTDLYNAWAAHGRSMPVLIVRDTISVMSDPTPVTDVPGIPTALRQNEPNPFNPATRIRYSLREKGHVVIRVYDLRGALVRTLIDAVKPSGVYDVVWNGTNDAGARVASGVYFYRMKAPSFVSTRKALLLK